MVRIARRGGRRTSLGRHAAGRGGVFDQLAIHIGLRDNISALAFNRRPRRERNRCRNIAGQVRQHRVRNRNRVQRLVAAIGGDDGIGDSVAHPRTRDRIGRFHHGQRIIRRAGNSHAVGR